MSVQSPKDRESQAAKSRVVIGDARDMEWLGNESTHLVVTSPPYWQIKDYGHESQTGHGQSFEGYINDLNLVWQECARVLVPGGKLCINIGDQFVGAAEYGRFKVMPIHAEIIKFCETVGLDYLGSIIWRKITNTATSGGGSLMGSYPYPRAGVVKMNYEFILLFRRPGATPAPSAESKNVSAIPIDDWKQCFTADWTFGGERQVGHIAMFPRELPERLIRMFSFPGETVLDPFLGSGTTAAAANSLGRNAVGVEINDEFLDLIRTKVGAEGPVAVERAPSVRPDRLRTRMASWRYRFIDFSEGLSRRTPTETKSKAAFKAATRYRVTGVHSATTIETTGGIKVQLDGLVSIADREAEAMAFLAAFKGQKIVLLDDKEVSEGVRSGLVLLENHLFVNGRLLRTGSVAIAEATPEPLRGRLERQAAKAEAA